MHEQYNGFFLTRLYSSKRIKAELGKIPEDAVKFPLPSLLENLTGEFYCVNQIDKHLIDGNQLTALLISMMYAAERAHMREVYRNI